MIFTSAPLARQQISSSVFKDHGNGNEAPVPISESRISVVTNFVWIAAVLNLQFLWAFTASFLLDKAINIRTTVNAVQAKVSHVLFESPPLVVTFPGKTGDNIEAALSDLGFTKHSLNKYQYYKGPGNDSVIAKLLSLGAIADSYSPLGTCNINGFVCLGIMNRVLHGALGFLASWDKSCALLVVPDTEETTVNKESWKDYAITSPEAAQRGHFFPYFDGLNLADKANAPRIFLSLFHKLLGNNGKEVLTATRTIQEGWPSISTTPAGLQLSHLMFGISLAITAPGITLKPVILQNEYSGFVLEGAGMVVFKGSTQINAVAKDVIAEEIGSVNQHDAALRKIAEILSEQLVDDDGSFKKIPVLPSQLTSPRHIHYFMKNRSTDEDTHGALKVQLDKTRFRSTYWDVTDRVKIAVAIEAISKKRWLDIDAPFAMKSNAMFTKDPVYSTLAAFGLKSFSLIGPGNNASISVTKGGKFYQDFKPAHLTGIPVFAKPLQTAFEEMTALMKSGVISFKHGGNDKHGIAKVIGQSSMIPHDTAQARRIIDALVDSCVSKGDKRKREDGDIDVDTEKIDAQRKKRALTKVAGISTLLMGGTAPVASTSGSRVDDDMDEDFM